MALSLCHLARNRLRFDAQMRIDAERFCFEMRGAIRLNSFRQILSKIIHLFL